MARKKRGTASKPGKKALQGKQDASLYNRQHRWVANSERYVTSQSKTNGYNMRIPGLTFLKVLVLFLIMTWLHGCIKIRSRDVHQRAQDPNEYRSVEDVSKDTNLHRGRWWNYYEFGSRFLAAGHHREALDNFEIAINKRDKDTRDARTYGMHFVDYFPHRESGIAYYLQGLDPNITKKEEAFEKAMEELKTSISQEPSSKAMFYLKRATEGFWSATKKDIKPPVVWIENDAIDRWEDVPTLYIDGPAVALEIGASDDQSRVGKVFMYTRIGKVIVDEEELFVESVREPFEAETIVIVNPNEREKTVEFKAIDLAGNESLPVSVRLIVDTTPPTGAIKFLPKRPALFGGRITMEIIAMDDRGLKSVQIGDDPYNNRDCRGKSMWRGEFSAEPGVRDLPVEITDRAGNMTAMSVTLESEQVVAGIGRNERLFAYNTSLGYSWNSLSIPFNVALRGPDNFMNHHVQYSTLGIHNAPSLLRYEYVQVANSSESKPPELLFPEFDFTDEPVSASGDEYLLQGQVTNTRDYRLLGIVVNGEEIKQIEMLDAVDNRSFSTWVPLPDCNHPDCNQIQHIEVHAYFEHISSGEKFSIDRTNLEVKSVPDSPWIGDSLYSVILLPLEDIDLQQSKARDYKNWPTDEHRDACDWVKAAVDQYISLPDRGKPLRRFDCNDLDRWKLVQADQKLWYHYREQKGGPRTRTRTTADWELAQRASDLAEAYATDLGIYGLFKLEGNKFDIKIGFTRVKSDGEHLLPRKWIDIYGPRNKRDYYVKGLKSKLKIWMPRISGQIHDILQDGTIEVELGQQCNVFENMDLLLYDVSRPKGNTIYEEKCNAKVNDRGIFVKQFTAKVEECSSGESWASLVERWKDGEGVCVMSK
jgi:hypothetical protein